MSAPIEFNFETESLEELAAEISKLDRNLHKMVALVNTTKGRAAMQAGLLIVARAKEITTEKNHIQHGLLRRSWNVQLIRDEFQRVVAEVGSPLEYAEAVEALPREWTIKVGRITRGGRHVDKYMSGTGKRPRRVGPRGGKYPSRGEGGGILGPAAEQMAEQAFEVMMKIGFEPALKRFEL